MPTFRDTYTGRNGRRYAAQGTHANGGIPASCYINAKAEIRSYNDANTFLDGQVLKNVASNVAIVRRSPTTIAVRLYSTDIITYHDDETFSFSNGGFYTPTTSTRCNQFGPNGYHFSHNNRILHANGTPEQDGNRLPVHCASTPARPKVNWVRACPEDGLHMVITKAQARRLIEAVAINYPTENVLARIDHEGDLCIN